MRPPAPRDPFGPIEGIVTALLTLLLISFIGYGATAVVASVRDESLGASIATIGDDETCVVVNNEAPNPSISNVPQRGVDRDRAELRLEKFDLCIKDASPTEELLSSLKSAGDLIFALGGLVLVRRAIRTARRNGIFSLQMVRGVRTLGWFMLFMTLPWPLVAAAGKGVLIRVAIPDRSIMYGLMQPDISIALVVVSLGVISIARVLQRGVALQEDVDATV